MKKTYPAAGLAALCLLFGTSAACTKDDDASTPSQTPPQSQPAPEPETPAAPTELLLSSVIQEPTRAAFSSADTQIAAGSTVSVWVDDAAGTALYQKNMLTANGSGGFSGGTPMYFPQSGSLVNIYALHTSASLPTAYPAEGLIHAVKTDQRTAAAYVQSDLLYAKAANIAETANAVPLVFYHLLAKVQVAVVPGTGVSASDIVQVAIGGTKIQAALTLDKANAPTAAVISPAGSTAPIAIGADLSASFSAPAYNDAIIVPQTVSRGTRFIILTLNGGAELAYALPDNVTFERGKKYIYQITVNRTGLSIRSSVADWSPGDIVSGEAELI